MLIPIFFVSHWYLSLFAQTFFLHRYAAHGMFALSKFWERFFFLVTYVLQGASFLNPRAYAILHRLHHTHSDTELDPHSPHNHGDIFSMMWKTKEIYLRIREYKFKVPAELEKNIPRWNWLEWFGETWMSRFGWGTAYVAFYYFVAEAAWYWYFLLPVHFLMGPIQGAIVNWFGHKLGYQNFDNHDKSRNTLAMDVLLMGELYQNNHHKLPLRARFAVKWFEFDPTYVVMWAMDKIGVIRLKRRKRSPRRPAAVAAATTV